MRTAIPRRQRCIHSDCTRWYGSNITDFLLEHQWLSPNILVLLLLTGPIAARMLADRPRVAWWLTAAWLLPVIALTVTPQDRQLFARCTYQWALPTPSRVELMANTILFIAPALLATVASRRPFRVLIAGALLSGLVEVVQATAPALGRSCDTSDWLTNTIGVAIGVLLAWLGLQWARGSMRPVLGAVDPLDRPSS